MWIGVASNSVINNVRGRVTEKNQMKGRGVCDCQNREERARGI